MAFIDVSRIQHPAKLAGTDGPRPTETRLPYRSGRLAVIAISAGVGHQLADWSGALGGTVIALVAVAMFSSYMTDRRIRSAATRSRHAPRVGHEPKLWTDGDASGQL